VQSQRQVAQSRLATVTKGAECRAIASDGHAGSFARQRFGSNRTTDTRCGDRSLAALADYGITDATQNDLKGVLDRFANKKESTREAVVERKVETLSLPEGIASVRSIFRNEIDKMMMAFRKSHPDFYKAYFAARIIVNRAATRSAKEEEPASPPAAPGP
jgi:hypothetical protein